MADSEKPLQPPQVEEPQFTDPPINPDSFTPDPSEETGFFVADESSVSGPNDMPITSNPVNWTASEFISHEKTATWYMVLTLISAGLAGLLFLFTRDLVTVVVVVICAVVFGVYAARKPKEIPYQVDTRGVSIGNKRYNYTDFRSFALIPEGAFGSIIFMPLKRFSPLITIYYPPEDEDIIVDKVASQLPNEQRHFDAVDQLMRRIRF